MPLLVERHLKKQQQQQHELQISISVHEIFFWQGNQVLTMRITFGQDFRKLTFPGKKNEAEFEHNFW